MTAPQQISHDARLTISRHFCIPDDQQHLVPSRRRAPKYLPAEAPLPRPGEIVYLSSSSAWLVSHVVHEWRTPRDLRIEIWLQHAGSSREARPAGFEMTQ